MPPKPEKTQAPLKLGAITQRPKRRLNRAPDVHATFHKALKDFPQDGNPTKQFKMDIEDFVTKSPKSKDNFFHLMARWKPDWSESGSSWSDQRRGFFEWMMREYPDLLLERNSFNQAPMHIALGDPETSDVFVSSVLEFRGFERIEEVLELESAVGNCFHLAVQNDCPWLEEMIKKCSKTSPAFECQAGEDQNTPLHIAVTKLQLQGRNEPDAYGEILLQLKKETERPRQSIENEVAPQKDVTPLVRRISFSTDHGDNECDGEDARLAEIDLENVQLLVEACPKALGVRNKANRTPYQEREHALLRDSYVSHLVNEYINNNGKHEKDARRRAERRIFVDDPIASYLRSYCMHNSDSREQTISRLYRPGQERQVEFDLAGMEGSVAPSYLEQLANHLRFESILKYVALPILELEAPRRATQRSKTAFASQTRDSNLQKKGRSDLVAIFDWLWRNGVREIIKVMVIDDRDPPHADSAIIDALYGFKVEEWDWKRIDLCSDVISESTQFVREVSLYASGNNAVLMGWAGADGFGNREKFPKLEKVDCYVRQGLEDDARWKRYTQKFVEKLKNQSSQAGRGNEGERQLAVNIIADDKKASYLSDFLNSDGYLAEDPPWIKSIENFAAFLRNSSITQSETPDGQKVAPVKIAIIDDGIDATVADLQPRIAGGETFFPYRYSSQLMNPYFVPSGNHGTLMAQLICTLCPDVMLYIARLEELPTLTGNDRRVTAKSAAKAVSWATDCGVDIISMSWTIQSSTYNDSATNDLREAIYAANSAGILMFCSASDQGSSNNEMSYPGEFNVCVRIGAATFTGDKLQWVEDKVDYLFPGRRVPFRTKDKKSVTHESGSSVATAAASGLAGVLLYCDRLLQGGGGTRSSNPRLAKITHMRKAFSKMSTGTDNRFPRPVSIFEDEFRKLLLQQKDPKMSKKPDIAGLEWSATTKKALSDLFNQLT